jgi:hypothetical protein
MSRQVAVSLGAFAGRALSGEGANGAEQLPSRLVAAMRVYLHDKGLGRPGWRFPEFARGQGPREGTEVALSLDQELWSAFEAEAAEQGVSSEQLLEHAALYFAAELDSGRITGRILEESEEA